MNNYTLVDYFNGFTVLANRHNLTSNVQATFYAILREFNQARFPEEMEISTRVLQKLAGIGCVSTAHEAKRILKNIGAIDFTTRKGKTVYKLKDEHFLNRRLNIRETKRERPANTAACGSPLLSVSEDRPDSKTQTQTAPANTKGGITYEERKGGGSSRIDWAVDPYAGLERD